MRVRARKVELPTLKEAEIQKQCLEWLNLQWGVMAWRRNVGAFAGEYNGKKRFMRFGQKGQSDIEGVGPKGVHIEVEIKRPGKRPTSKQELWLAKMVTHGAVAFWCTSLDECIKKCAELGLTVDVR